MLADLALLLPEITVLLSGVAALVAEMLRAPRVGFAAALVGLVAAMALALDLLGTDTTVFGGTFRIDYLSVWAKLVLLPATVLTLVMVRAELRGSDREGTAYSLVCFTLLGALVLAGAGDVMFLVLGVLLTSLGSFALTAYPRDDRATEAAFKYFVFGSVTGAVMIFGLTFWFGASGTTLLSESASLSVRPLAAALAFTAVLVGLGYKASLVPFHFWAPDAYDGAPVSVAAFLSIVPKIGALFALAAVVRIMPEGTGVAALLTLVAALSMTYGNLAALLQTNVVRLLAYSSVAQSGYFLLGVMAISRSELAPESLVVFAAAYAAMNLGAFAVVLQIGRELTLFTGVGRHVPVLGVAMVICLLSLVGVPPLAGFVGKLLLFGAAMDAGFTGLVVVAIINSALSLAVYLRVIAPMYRRGTVRRSAHPLTWPVWGSAAAATLVLGLAAQLLLLG